MAEAIVSLVVNRFAELLDREAVFLSGVRGEFTRLQDDLRWMQSFLKAADRVEFHVDHRIQYLVAQVREIANESEDVIDTFILKNAARSRRGLIKRFTSIFSKGLDFHETGKQIEDIQKRITSIHDGMQFHGILPDTESQSSSSSVENPTVEEEHIISFDAEIEKLTSMLMAEEENLRVLSIVGMGGQGKTTLAKKVYNNLKQDFESYAFVYLPERVTTQYILVRIMKDIKACVDKSRTEEEGFARIKRDQSFKSLLDTMEVADLVRELSQMLSDKRYLVVLDNIWHKTTWDGLRQAFPHGMKGSKVLLTTRHHEVASHANPDPDPGKDRSIVPPLLTGEQGWELLSRKAFSRGEGDRQRFKELGMEMVRKCGGLPLALVAIGGQLANKRSLDAWEKISSNSHVEFTTSQIPDPPGVYDILAKSYYDLPFHLKPCFLYLSQFPENCEFHKRSVIRLWVAEGFIEQQLQETKGKQTMEDVAERYLNELVSRCMVQVSKIDSTGYGVKFFKMLDAMQHMCKSKARDEKFSVAMELDDNLELKSSINRRIAIHSCKYGGSGGKLFHLPFVECDYPHLRTLAYFVEENQYGMTKSKEVHIHKNFKLIRILNLEGITLTSDFFGSHHMHKVVKNLIHLRYLGLRNTRLWEGKKLFCLRLKSLSASIGRLNNLCTLDVRDNCFPPTLPYVAWNFRNLRHLLLDHSFFGSIQLKNEQQLETLKWVRAKNLIRKNNVSRLVNLRNFGIEFGNDKEEEIVLKSDIFKAGHVRSLKMRMSSGSSFSYLFSLSHCRCIKKLVLQGGISDPQRNLQFLPKYIIKLILEKSNLTQDSMSVLEKLLELRILSLNDAFKGSKMVCSAGGFLKLEILELVCFYEVEEWEIENGAMPCLKTLHLDHPNNLREIPEGFKFMTTVQTLKLTHLQDELKRRVQKGGRDYSKIRHMEPILFD